MGKYDWRCEMYFLIPSQVRFKIIRWAGTIGQFESYILIPGEVRFKVRFGETGGMRKKNYVRLGRAGIGIESEV